MTARVSSGERREAEGKIGLIGMMAFVLLAGGTLLFVVLWPDSHRGHGYDTVGAGACWAYFKAQTTYKRTDWDKDGKFTYAASFPLLNTTPDASGNPIQLIDSAFAAATSPATPKHGYYFGDMSTIGGKPIDPEKDFALCATPAVYGKTGYRTFIVCTNGTTFGKDLGRSEFVDDYPADPAAEGWIIAE